MLKVSKNPRRPIAVGGGPPKFPGISRADSIEQEKIDAWKRAGKKVPLSNVLNVVRNNSQMKRIRLAEDEERLRFLREQLRQGRLSTVLSVAGGRPGQGFQLGKRSILGEGT